jgi:sarcosine oxidase subunit delta
MLLIPCPLCGPRDESEFAYGGDADKRLPPLDGKSDVADWHHAVHLRDNPWGSHRELWHHAMGCECWIEVERDSRSHDILGSRLPRNRGGGR